MTSPYPAYGGYSSSYPPQGTYGNLASASTVNVNAGAMKNGMGNGSGVTMDGGPGDLRGGGGRTPSPTPSEQKELARESMFDWKTMMSWRFWFRREWLWYYVIGTILVVLSALITIYHDQIVDWLKPAANWMKDLPAGWLIPIAILFVISFPPLFGHEVVAILCGVVWGLWIGFALVAAGTFLGELGNFYAFKWCCRARGEKLERTSIQYGCLARVVREGGFKIALIARFSAIPGHFTTAVFSTCGMGVWTFALAAFFSLPKQFVTVYLGVLLENSSNETTGQKVASDAVVAVTVIVTVLAMWYIYKKMGQVKAAVIYDRRKARQNKLSNPYGNPSTSMLDSSASLTGPSTTAFNPSLQTIHAGSETDIPLHASSYGSSPSNVPGRFNPSPNGRQREQTWDENGRAVGYSGDPRLYAPQPQSAVPKFRAESPANIAGVGAGRRRRDEEEGVTYPISPRADGRIPVRQGSGESVAVSDEEEDAYRYATQQLSPPQQPYQPQHRPFQPPTQPPPQSQPPTIPPPPSSTSYPTSVRPQPQSQPPSQPHSPTVAYANPYAPPPSLSMQQTSYNPTAYHPPSQPQSPFQPPAQIPYANSPTTFTPPPLPTSQSHPYATATPAFSPQIPSFPSAPQAHSYSNSPYYADTGSQPGTPGSLHNPYETAFSQQQQPQQNPYGGTAYNPGQQVHPQGTGSGANVTGPPPSYSTSELR